MHTGNLRSRKIFRSRERLHSYITFGMSCRQIGHSFWAHNIRILVEHSLHTGWLHIPTAYICIRFRHTGQCSSEHSEYTRSRFEALDTFWLFLLLWSLRLLPLFLPPPLSLWLLIWLFSSSWYLLLEVSLEPTYSSVEFWSLLVNKDRSLILSLLRLLFDRP